MIEEPPFHICEMCRERVDPADPGVVIAVEVQRIDRMGGTDCVEGLGSYFHEEHFPAALAGG